MRKYLYSVAVIAAFSASPAIAETLKANYPVCVTQELLDQMYDAALKEDSMAMDYLFGHGCFASKQGVRVSVIGRSNWGAAVHVRVYGNKVATEAWTSVAALEGYDSLNPSSAR